MTKIEAKKEIKEILDGLKAYDAREIAHWVFNTYDYSFDWYRVKATDEMKEIAKRIFELCPQANCIPVAYNNVDENDYFTEYEDYNEVWNMADCFLHIEKRWGYQMPYFDDEMKKKEWDEVTELCVKLHDLIGGEDTHEDGDFCQDSHPSFIVFSKEKNDFEETEELR